jgi:LuxR family maltose regulon positive regulatory protein
LARLAGSELFLSKSGDWYDLRREYADVWRNRLFHKHHDQLPELHLRASEWYERNGFVDEAIRHAMAASDYGRATRLIGEAAPICIQRGEMSTLLGWLGALPDPVIKSSASLCIFHAWALFLTGNFHAAECRITDAERAPDARDSI